MVVGELRAAAPLPEGGLGKENEPKQVRSVGHAILLQNEVPSLGPFILFSALGAVMVCWPAILKGGTRSESIVRAFEQMWVGRGLARGCA